MNPPPDSTSPPDAELPGGRTQMPDAGPTNWAQAIVALVASRIALIRFEARESARHGLRRVLRIVAAVLCVFFTWILVLAGAIGGIAAATGWPWYWLAIAAAAIHLLAALLLASGGKNPETPAFPLTRAEFQKDREWIESIQKKPKSNA